MPRASIVSPFAGALLLGIPASSFAQSRTAVSVETRIMVPRFRDQFGSEVDSVERNVARHFRRTLAKEVGFLDFAVNDTTARYRLLFIFDVRERDVVSPFPEFGFRVRLEEPDSTHVERYWLTMRASDRATAGVGTPDAFLDALGAKLTHADLGTLRDSILTKIPVTEQALVLASPLGWVIKSPRLTLCMKDMSRIEVLSDFRQNGNGMSIAKTATAQVVSDFQTTDTTTQNIRPFIGGAFSEPPTASDRDELNRQLVGGQLTVKEVFVTTYIHDPNACRDREKDDGK